MFSLVKSSFNNPFNKIIVDGDLKRTLIVVAYSGKSLLQKTLTIIMKTKTDFESIIRIDLKRSKLVVIFLAAILFYAAALILWKQNEVDNEIVIYFNFVYANENYLQFFKVLSAYGMPFITFIYVLLIYLSAKKENLLANRPLFFLIIVSFFLTTIGGDLLKEILDKARPVIALSEQLAIQHVSSTPAFPSGHAAKSMALALPFVLLASRKNNLLVIAKTVLLLAAGSVCFSRIALQAHFLSDVLAGIGTALFFISPAVWLANRFFAKLKMDEIKLTQMTKRLLFVYLAFTAILCYI